MSMFENALKGTLNNEVSITENGAIGFKTTGQKLLDLNFATSSLRNKSDVEIEKMFIDAFNDSPAYAIKWLFFLRDREKGMGERRSFRVMFSWLARTRPEIAKLLFTHIPEFGRFDDLWDLTNTSLNEDIIKLIAVQLTADIEALKNNKPVSLLAKWMPSINTSSDKTRNMARRFCKALNMSERTYRKTLSMLRKHLDVIEVKMSAREWKAIDYEKVCSKANLKYNSAFLRNDETRRREFLGKLEKGEAKINAGVAFPSDIVAKYTHGSYGYRSTIKVDSALEAMWKALPDFVSSEDSNNSIVVADGSGSMTSSANGNGRMTCLDVANAIAIYFSEKLKGPYANKYITFSETPKYVNFSNCKSLAEKITLALRHDECANTNIEAVFELILKSAIDYKLKQEDLPKNIIIVSDMEFDCGVTIGAPVQRYGYYHSRSYGSAAEYSAAKNSLFVRIAKAYKDAGYTLPRLVYWNVNSRTGTIPLKQAENGVALVSGYSPAVAKMVFSAKLDPWEALKDSLDVPRYEFIEAVIERCKLAR